MSLTQAMTPVVLTDMLVAHRLVLLSCLKNGARFDSLTPSAPSPGQGLKRTLHSSTNKLNKSLLVEQNKKRTGKKRRKKTLKIGRQTHHHQCKKETKTNKNIPDSYTSSNSQMRWCFELCVMLEIN